MNEHLQLEIKEVSEQGTFEGLLSPYGNTDSGGDMVEKGAYTKTLKERGSKVHMLWQHKTDTPVGVLELSDRPDGLYAKGSFFLGMKSAQEAYEWVKASKKAGLQPGLSIGYKTMKDEVKDGVRHLREIKLYEGSVVTFGMNEAAVIESVKAARTKRVDGVDLPASAFAYVGDPELTSTWKLPIDFPNEDQTKRHIRNALARLDQTQGIPASEKPAVRAKVQAAAKKYGIGDSAKSERKDFNDELVQTQTLAQFDQMLCALRCALRDAATDGELSREEKITEAENSVNQFAAAMIDFFPDYLDARDAAMSSGMYYYGREVDETKAGATFSAANMEKIQSGLGQIMSGHNDILALLEGKAGDPTLSRKAADPKSEPAHDHSAAEIRDAFKGIRSLIPA